MSFDGFNIPESNYFKVPNSFWNINDLTIHEKFVLLYILRHTWGYQEFGIMKHITVNEFQKGRREKDGSRMDEGCGVSRGAISNALKKLESRGYILIETDDSDAGRIKKSYCLNMVKDSVHLMNTEFMEGTQSSSDSSVRSSDGDRTEKETKKETSRKKVVPPAAIAQSAEPLVEVDKDFAQVMQSYERWFGIIKAGDGDILKGALEDYSPEWICKALEESAKNDVRKWKYTDAILQRWKQEGRSNSEQVDMRNVAKHQMEQSIQKSAHETGLMYAEMTGEDHERTA